MSVSDARLAQLAARFAEIEARLTALKSPFRSAEAFGVEEVDAAFAAER